MHRKFHASQALLISGLILTVIAAPADARRGGSFGSRGMRTYSAPASTSLSPGYTAPVSRSMTARPAVQSPQNAPSSSFPSYQSRPRFGFGGGLLTGIVAGGLIGAMMGHGWGGGFGGHGSGGGMLALLIQLIILGGVAWFVLRLFRGGSPARPPQQFDAYDRSTPMAGAPYATPLPYNIAPAAPPMSDIVLTGADQDMFEQLLMELQDAFGAEDYARLRAVTTPEIMSYLAEELSENATHGRRNQVTATRLLDGEISEAWHETDADYATIAMRYESIDVMKDRSTGVILSGDPGRPTETTELWTFVRSPGAGNSWKVSAIQEA